MSFLLVVFLFGLAVYIFFDAKKIEGQSRFAFLWLAATIIFPYIAIPLYFILKINKKTFYQGRQNSVIEPGKLTICPKCGEENSIDTEVCLKCKNNLKVVG